MKTQDFHYDLPVELIAQFPLENRAASRLLCMQHGQITDTTFADIINIVQAGDILVFNNTRVIPARLYGQKQSGGKIECLIERITGENSALAHVKASKSPKAGQMLEFASDLSATVVGRRSDLFELEFNQPLMQALEQQGHMPLPPYIQRDDAVSDKERYQTVYAAIPGAVAAPTAGLHFDEQLMQRLADKGVETAFVTLHVGAGTFQPVRVDNIEEHQMHHEYVEIDQSTVDKILQARTRGGRIIAVGTTSVRVLETASQDGVLAEYKGDTNIFIYPGYSFKSVDALITNFHLPESTLLMLVSAFAGYDAILHAYQYAIANRYRFFSYGDAMFLVP